MERIERHDITVRILFTFLTCGLYGLYWMAQITDDVHKLSGKPQCASGKKAVLFSILTCFIYPFYWIYKIGGELVEARHNMGMKLDAVKNSVYMWAIIAMTVLIPVFYGVKEYVGMTVNEYAEGISDSTKMTLVIFIMGIVFVIQVFLALIALWLVYKRSNPSPRVLYVVMYMMKTNIFTLGFLQASLNDIADAQEDGIIPTKSV